MAATRWPSVCDVTDAASVEALFDTIRERRGRLDVLFNNAGRNGTPVDIDELPIEEWRSVVDTNLTGVFLCTRAAFGLMKTQTPRGGRIINNGSISAHAPRPNSIAYTATKHAITGLTKAVSLDGRKYDIVCGQIDIGNAETEMAERMARGVPQANGEIAVEPLMDVQHVADAVLHMAELPLVGERAVHDDHGEQDAVRRPGVKRGAAHGAGDQLILSASRLHGSRFAVPRATPKDDPQPVPPVQPDLDDCCHSGCSPCVFDLYDEALERYQVALAEWQDAAGSKPRKRNR